MDPKAPERERAKRPTGAGLLCRAAPAASRTIDEEARTATFVAATERPVEIWGGVEVLRMAGARLDRFVKNPVVLDGHFHGDVVGRAVASIDGRQLRSVVTFARTERAEELWGLVRDGFLRAVSVGYRVLGTREIESGEFDGEGEARVEGPAVIVDQWELCEISLVPLPADEDALLVRSFYGARRAPETPPMTASNARAADAPADAPAKSELAQVAVKLGLAETATLAEVLAALDEEETAEGEAADDMARSAPAVEARAAELVKARTAVLEREVADLRAAQRRSKDEANRREIESAREACATAGDPSALDADREKDVLADFARGDDERARRELARCVDQARGSGKRSLLSQGAAATRSKKADDEAKAEAAKILEAGGYVAKK